MSGPALLRPETISRLQQLIELNIDCAKGFSTAAEHVASPSIKSLLQTSATARQGFAAELQSLVASGGERPKTSGTALGSMYRWWTSIRGTIAQGDEYAMLAEAERGEDAIKAAYESALKDNLGAPVQSILTRQYESVRQMHDQVRSLRDHAKVAPSPSTSSDRSAPPKSVNPDAITGEPGAHPVGTGIGAAGGGLVGAGLGSVAGPIGTVIGAAAGGIAGGYAGKAVAEEFDPTAEDAYWRTNYQTRAYAAGVSRYEDVQPAYRFGWESARKYPGRSFSEIEPTLEREWSASHSAGMLWNQAKRAAYDAWDRIAGSDSGRRPTSGRTP